MANEFRNITAPTIGKAWAFVVSLWETWVQDDAKVISASATPSGKLITIGYDDGVDTLTYNITPADVGGSGILPPAYVLNCPGWRRMPHLLAEDYGNNNTKESFEAVIKPLRAEILNEFLGFFPITWNHDLTDFDGGVNSDRWYVALKRDYIQALDALVLQTYTVDYEKELLDNEPTMDGILATPQYFSAGGGGTGGGGDELVAVLQQIRDALEEISTRRIDINVNNGELSISASGTASEG